MLDHTANMLKNALDGLQHRQLLLSNNIANATTPGYVTRQVDFKGVLSRLQAGDAAVPLQMSVTSASHAGPLEGAADAWQAATSFGSGPPDVKQQMVAVSENSLQYAAVAQALGQQISRYKLAIREGK